MCVCVCVCVCVADHVMLGGPVPSTGHKKVSVTGLSSSSISNTN